jgi:prepilin-type N-terminal cleavage/methylation domain-containing protein
VSSRAKRGDRKILRLLCRFTPSNDDKPAFTLAEVLITLLIIGVVASIVVPNLINDAQQAEFKVAWKKAYSEVDQATRKIMLDNGGTMKGLCGNWDSDCLKNFYMPYLNTVKSCDSGNLWGQCWSASFRYLSGGTVTWTEAAGAVLSNGTFIVFGHNARNCDETWPGIPICAQIYIDVNGFKTPNVVGKDIYLIHVVENTIKPMGTQGDNYTNTCNTSGLGCAAKYLYN